MEDELELFMSVGCTIATSPLGLRLQAVIAHMSQMVCSLNGVHPGWSTFPRKHLTLNQCLNIPSEREELLIVMDLKLRVKLRLGRASVKYWIDCTVTIT